MAHYDQCHGRCVEFLAANLMAEDAALVKGLFRSPARSLFMEGALLEKAEERGLTLPYRWEKYLIYSLLVYIFFMQ